MFEDLVLREFQCSVMNLLNGVVGTSQLLRLSPALSSELLELVEVNLECSTALVAELDGLISRLEYYNRKPAC